MQYVAKPTKKFPLHQDVTAGLVDGKSLVTYLSLLFLSLLPQPQVEGGIGTIQCEEVDQWPSMVDPLFTGGLSGSPVKSPTR